MEWYTWMMKLVIKEYDPPCLIIPKLCYIIIWNLVFCILVWWKASKSFLKHAVVDSAFLKNLTSIVALHSKLRAVLFDKETELVVVDYFKGDHGLITIEKMCKLCDTEMCFNVKASLRDKFAWRCKRKGCKTNILVRDSSFVMKSKLPSKQLGVSQLTLVDSNKIPDLKLLRFKLYLIFVLRLLYWGGRILESQFKYTTPLT